MILSKMGGQSTIQAYEKERRVELVAIEWRFICSGNLISGSSREQVSDLVVVAVVCPLKIK